MDDFPDLFARDFGFKPQGKAAPMAPSRNSSAGRFGSFPSSNLGLGSDFVRSSSSARSQVNSAPVFDDHDGATAVDGLIFDDVFGGPPKYASSESRAPTAPAFDYDGLLGDQKISKSSSIPVYDKPVYDDDIFEGIPGLKSSSAASSARYDDVFASISASPPKQKKQDSSPFDDLLGDLGRKDAEEKKMDTTGDTKKEIPDFNDLIPGFGRSSERLMPELNNSHKSYPDSTRVPSSGMDDLFSTSDSASKPQVSSSGVSTDPLEEAGQHVKSRSRKPDQSSVPGGVFVDLDPLDDLGKSMPDTSKRGKDTMPMRTENMNVTQSTVENFQSQWQGKDPDDFQGSHQSPFDLSSGFVDGSASPSDMNRSPNVANSRTDTTSGSGFDSSDDVWLTVSEIPLFTQPTSAPPPSRPPPPRPARRRRSESGSFSSRHPRKTNDGPSTFESSANPYSSSSDYPSARSFVTSPIDELEDFATGRARSEPNGYPAEFAGEDLEANSAAAAAMKEAMEKAEANIRHAREMRERENIMSFRSKENLESDKDDYEEKEQREKQERLDSERQQRLREEEEKEQRRLEKERARARELEWEQEERERERRRLEKERMERERELARQAVERATREARERAAAEARAKAQKAAVEKAAAEARERAEKAAVQRAQAEARERAAMEARQKAEKAAAGARERANAEARERDAREARARAERAAVERAAAEARERAAAEARERAAAQARANQQRNDNDLESFFASRPSSAPRASTNASEPAFDMRSHRGPPETARASTGAPPSMRKVSSTTNIVDDLSSIFGAAESQSGVFREVDGETEERRRARLERHQRTQERAAKALAEKNERDLQTQREQAERHRVAESLDFEIRRWAAGKEGNLRAMLSTLQYVLWPECGWQPVSLTDLITAASVKKVYRKATLCIHPDKVQQKGATLQQKYVAEKVFDLLKEAWNKFNSEELF